MINRVEEILVRGCKILEQLFSKHGFAYMVLDAGESSGGQFALGEFRRGGRRLVFHFRHSLGMVTYHFNSLSMSHQEYMRSDIGRPNASHHPGFSSDPMDSFRHLQLDLEEHCVDFLEGSDECLRRRIEDALATPYVKPGLPD